VLIYDQTCAAEKRRRRKRKLMVDPPKRAFINSLVCEGCGDCFGEVELRVGAAARDRVRPQARDRPVELQQGLLLREGLLPELRHDRRRLLAQAEAEGRRDRFSPRCRCRPQPALDQPWNILVTGIGGTGVVTIGALVGMAAHLEGKGASVLDQTGSRRRAARSDARADRARPKDIHAVRIAAGEADLVLGCDMVVVNDYWALSKIRAERSRVV
jgi:indolepyruvate ferredoxin oxidoreductase